MKNITNWIANEPTWLISPIEKIVNRKQRRDYLHQAERINKVLNDIEASFVSYLFDIPSINTYESIYLKHLESFKSSVDWFNNHGNLRNVQINESYFVDKYKPVVK